MSGDEPARFPWPFGPMTPEQQAEYRKRQLEGRSADERRFVASLPHLKEAQRALREAHAVGVGGHRFNKVASHLAVLIEEIELELVRPAS